jgi:hypothetical protein
VDDRPALGIFVMTDLTARKLAETALRESEQRVSRKLASVLSPDGDLGMINLADLLDAAALVKGELQLHGAAARLGLPGDPVILISHGVLSAEEAARSSPRVVFGDDRNRMVRPPLRAEG